ncbi:MAG: copper resistance protein B [Gammaproteobacteria bacterium]|nr:copper resistance protein B [Gammaproteobacteria bacterium]
MRSSHKTPGPVFPQALALAVLLAVASFTALGAGRQGRHAPEDWPPSVAEHAYGRVLFDRLEHAEGDEEDTLSWEIEAWYGGDYNRLWVETEGEDVTSGGEGGEIENLDVLYSRLVAPYWDVQAGVGYQGIYGTDADEDRGFAVLGVQGLAPHWFEVDANLRVSDEGDVSADFEAEYDLLLTQRLILQPRFETSVAAGEVEEFGVGEGFNFVKLGLRLRYEIKRELAPYIGVSWNRKLGDTADLAEAEGEDDADTAVVVGVRMWF